MTEKKANFGMEPESLKEFSCQICMDEFSDGSKSPRMLLCGHCFCHSCIENLISRSPICPLCREQLQFKNAEKFPVCVPVLKLIQSYQKSLGRKKEISQSRVLAEGFCEEHETTKQFKCMNCSDWVCGTCAILHHKKCRTLLVKEALKEMKNEEVKKIEDILQIKSKEDKNGTWLNELYFEKKAKLKKQIKSLQLSLKEKIQYLKNLQCEFEDFSLSETKRKKLWAPVVKSEMMNKDFTSNNQFESAKSRMNTDLKTVNEQQQDLTMVPKEMYSNLDLETMKSWLDGNVVLHAVRESQFGPQFSRLELINGKVRINCFQSNRPSHPFIGIPFRNLLSSLTKSYHLPGKAFFEIGPQGAASGQEVIVQTDATVAGSPRVQNFLLLVSGLKRASYIERPLSLFNHRDDGTKFVTVTSVWKKGNKEVEEAVVKGIEDNGIYGKPVSKRGFVCGEKAESNSSHVSFCLEDSKVRITLFGKFGEVESGLEALDQMKSGSELYVINCGFIID